jgi:UDP-N-acetylglucosamine--N-acetylmuramyl-(pentapeptide) pyrophosphoryl-undecaprenol N-acetylglucosamine transferase
VNVAGGAKPLVVVAAGGTGGHLFPAEALSAALQRRGIVVDLATDERATRYGTAFPARATHVIASATVRGRNPISLITTTTVLAYGLARALALFGRLKPAAVVGFGGYPTIPPVLAASLRGIPTLIHEQNGVLGRANRLLSGRVRAVATGFPGVIDRKPLLAAKATHTGTPVRAAVIEASRIPYLPVEPMGPFHLLAFGGSQGARIMADIVPPAVGQLPADLRQRLTVVQQVREEDLARVRDIYARLNVTAEVAPFFSDLPARLAKAHLIVSRAGASTVAELAAIGRPAILVPLPHALDQDQLANATVLERAGGAICVNQKSFTADWLAGELARLAAAPQKLVAMAVAARSVGAVDAADRLAELVIKVAQLDNNKLGQI